MAAFLGIGQREADILGTHHVGGVEVDVPAGLGLRVGGRSALKDGQLYQRVQLVERGVLRRVARAIAGGVGARRGVPLRI